jgi:hypothetical protein
MADIHSQGEPQAEGHIEDDLGKLPWALGDIHLVSFSIFIVSLDNLPCSQNYINSNIQRYKESADK